MMTFFIFIMGLIFGSFYTVVGLRLPNNESIVKPGSHCPKCNHQLKWYELIPVLSFIIQRGKCRGCQEKMSWLYPIIELLCATLFALCYYIYGFSYEFFAGVTITSVLITIFVSDFKYKIILDSPIIIGSIIIVGLKWYYFYLDAALLALIAGVGMFMFMFLIKVIGDKVFKKESLGGGDVKLSFFTGATLGIQLGLTSLILSSFLAFPYAIIAMVRKKDPEIPFGPFLISAVMIVFFFMEPIVTFIKSIL